MGIVSPSNRPYSDRIVPEWLWPRTRDAAASAAQAFATARPVAEQTANDYRVAAGELSELTAGDGFEAMVQAHHRLAIDHDNHADILGHLHQAATHVGNLGHSLAARLDSIDYGAHQEISAAPPEAREAIISRAHASAVAAHGEFTQSVVAYHTYVSGLVDPVAAGITGRTPFQADKDPSTQALDNDNALKHRGEKQAGGQSPGAGSGSASTAASTSPTAPGAIKDRGDRSDMTGAVPGWPTRCHQGPGRSIGRADRDPACSAIAAGRCTERVGWRSARWWASDRHTSGAGWWYSVVGLDVWAGAGARCGTGGAG